ncbi:MAG: hypothetical protein K2W96_19510 [Gemmataceae bacterium]|nr:hypothetical protein [Gemmataceae bacterium]
MGMDRAVSFPGEAPAWADVAALLRQHGAAVQMRMIDGELAFPDEAPPPGWNELRVSLAGEMVSIRREPGGVRLVAWGNATAAQRQLWNALAWAFATVGGAPVPEGEEMPPGWA